MKKTIVLAVGGSIIIPEAGKVNKNFLKKFRDFILKYVNTGKYRFIIIVGGGKTCRVYQDAAKNINKKINNDELDWIGIQATKLNAQMIRATFGKRAYPKIIDNPEISLPDNWSVLVASGWKPGWSTDYISTMFVKKYGAKEILDLGNIPAVYDKDPAKFQNAKPIAKLSWKEYLDIIGTKRIPGMSVPIDPVAAEVSDKANLKTLIVLGTDFKNLSNILLQKQFKGTIIQNERKRCNLQL